MLVNTLTVALVLSAASVFAQAPLVVNTPTDARQCENTLITISGGLGPYFLEIQRGNEVVESFQTGGTFIWNTNVPEGSQIVLQAIDADEHFVQSAAFVVQQGWARGGRVCGNVLDCV
ncbi:uncharacterized protein TRAVEDRAFT_24785 [Trametes versicolor FP-101664 SS1]|uniref:Uncharacterized protein n=1 Tax=Trametes versicolor (strain FP-101664) TaxID=717944 RepID=R7S7Y5_TRAVS|nr:uncharacterized protein TRAVEDRAFT_24785 [Trametes versicolor FP-101664 SS1]EIW52111.1 hypothetical protein TRAVEDRAFT_24785 [Trametes versicolor FP-101664 SS1]